MSLEHLQAFLREGNEGTIQVDHKEDTKPSRAILTASIVREQESRARYNEIGENIKKSERLRAELTKGIKNNEPVDDLLIVSLKCISLMTGDEVWYKQNKATLESRA